MAERLLIVGAGMAAARLAEELAARAPGRFAVTLAGAEPRAPYNRVLLSSLLAGEAAEAEAELWPRAAPAAGGATLLTGARVEALDLAGRRALLADGRALGFDRLVLATGAEPIRLPLPGADLPGVLTFRDMADVERLRALAGPGVRAIVIGGGLLGLEAAWGLKRLGAAATVLHLADRLMERQLDAAGGAALRRLLARKGLGFLMPVETVAIEGEARVRGLRLADGRLIPADLVVMAVGVRPNAALARAAGLACRRGIVVDDRLTTSHPAVHAIGDCAEHGGVVHGLVEPAWRQAEVLARLLAGEGAAYAGSTAATHLKVSGVGVFSAGVAEPAEGDRTATVADSARGLYRRAILRREGGATRLVGAILVGDIADGPWLRGLIESSRDVSAFADGLAFGHAFCGDLREAA